MPSSTTSSVPGESRAFRDPWEVVAGGLRHMILSGELLPGERIVETALADRFEVSRGPVREAIRALEVSGLVTRFPRRGTIVTPISPRDVAEVYALRECVEVYAVEVAMRRSDEIGDRAVGSAKHMRALAGSAPPVLIDADLSFHSEFYLAADNARVAAVWDGLRDPLRIMILLTSHRSPKDWERALRGHEAIASAVLAGDTEGAVAATREHLALARDRISDYLRSEQQT